MELDKLTQIHVNTKNITALAQQLQLVQSENVELTTKVRNIEGSYATLISDFNQLKQTVMVMKAMSMGHGPT